MHSFQHGLRIIVETLYRTPCDGFIGWTDIDHFAGIGLPQPEGLIEVLHDLAKTPFTFPEGRFNLLALGDVYRDNYRAGISQRQRRGADTRPDHRIIFFDDTDF